MFTAQKDEDVVRSKVPQTDDNTTENKSQDKKTKKYKSSYTLAFLLYPDNPAHGKCLADIIRRYDYAYILHDKDSKEMDFREHCLDCDNPLDVELIKKSHYHVLTFHPSCKRASQLAKELGIESRFVQEVSNRNAMLCYLTHMGDRGKHQYSFEEVVCNRPSIYLEGLQNHLTNTEKLEKMIAIIQNKNCKSVGFALKMLAFYGLTDFALRNFGVVKMLVEENHFESSFSQSIFSPTRDRIKFEHYNPDEDLPL